MKPENVFGLFKDDDEELPDANDIKATFDFSEHPIISMGLFIKHATFAEEVANQAFDINTCYDTTILILYGKAYNCLQGLNLYNSFHKLTIVERSTPKFLECLNNAIEFFAELEQYEKCAFIKTILDFTKSPKL